MPEETPDIQLTMTPWQFGDRLSKADRHIERASAWAAEKFARDRQLASISLEIGASFFVEFAVTLSWTRQGITGVEPPHAITKQCRGGSAGIHGQ